MRTRHVTAAAAALFFSVAPALACPSCPPGREARSEVWSDGFARNLATAIVPFLLIGAVALRAEAIGRRGKGGLHR